jgi:HAD superfamily hydrolase (TIGR01549 family)
MLSHFSIRVKNVMMSKNLSDSRHDRVTSRSLSRLRHWLRKHGFQKNVAGPERAVGTAADFPLFDVDWYLSEYPDVALEGVDPKVHFKRHGRFEGRRPSFYFDAKFYINAYLDGSLDNDPVEHYLGIGWRKGFSPNPYFSPAWYLSSNADVADAGVEPLWHYTMFGWREGRNPSPYFDVDHYLESNPDIRAAGVEPLLHYIAFGHAEMGRNPNAFFDANWYRTKYMKSVADKDHPLQHYIFDGAALGYWPSPDFDPAYYFSSNPDISRAMEPLAHFLEHGRFERRKPHPDARPEIDSATAKWAVLNGASLRRTNLLISNLSDACCLPSPEEAARTAFLKEIAGAEHATFDIFDTLVERRSGKPETVFAMLSQRAVEAGFTGKDFVAARKEAELAARALAGEREVTIAEIYDAFAKSSRLPLDRCLALADAECTLEIELCEEKAIGRMLLETARSEGLSISLLSDIYLPRSTVEAILAKVGISGFSDLLVSSEIGATKHYGSMFDNLLAKLNSSPERIIHIGDNPHSDVAMPRSRGMRALLLQKSEAMSGSNTLVRWFAEDPATQEGFWKAVVSGNLIHREGRIHGKSALDHNARITRMHGGQALGPALLAFAQWLGRRAKTMGYKRLYFASRDGFYLKEAFDLLRRYDPDLPETAYLLASRKVCRSACVRTLDDMIEIASIDHYPMPVRQFLQVRLLLTDDDLKALEPALLSRTVRDAKSDADLHQVIQKLSPIIRQRCAAHHDAYCAYLRSIGLEKPGSAIVDIGYRGTVQRNLSDLLGTSIDGLYFVTWPAVSGLLSKGLRYSTFIASHGEPNDPLVRYVQLLELLMSGTHGSISHFATNGSGQGLPIMLDPDTHPYARHTLNALRGGALEFMDDVLGSCPPLLNADIPSGRDALTTMIEFFAAPSPQVVAGLADHVFEDLFGGETRSLVVSKGEASDLSDALSQSCWKEGTLALWRNNGKEHAKPATAMQDSPDRFEGLETISGATLN